MKKFILPVILMCCIAVSGFAQDEETKEQKEIKGHMEEAYKMLDKEQYRDAASVLQDAINVINDMIGEEILASLPESINNLESSTTEDQTTSLGSLMGAGITVTRNYHNEEGKVITVTITPNSPQLNMVETFLANPDDYKDASHIGSAVKVGKRKAMLKYDDTREVSFAYMQMPLGNTLVTFRGDRIDSADDMIEFAAALDYKELGKALGMMIEEQ